MKKVPAEMQKSIRNLMIALIFLGLLAACERPATRTNWSPINDAEVAATAESLPETLPTQTARAQTVSPTAAAEIIGTLDVSQLPDTLPHSMKGYELFSWQVDGEWYFTLITGTNRNKSFDEIITPGNTVGVDGFIKVSVCGIDQLKLMLGLLPAGEEVIWSGMDLGGQVPTDTIYLTLPPDAMIDEIKTFSNTLGIRLTAIKPQ